MEILDREECVPALKITSVVALRSLADVSPVSGSAGLVEKCLLPMQQPGGADCCLEAGSMEKEKEELVQSFRRLVVRNVDELDRSQLMPYARKVLGVQVRRRSLDGKRTVYRSVPVVRQECKAVDAYLFYLGDLGKENVDAMKKQELMEYACTVLGVRVREAFVRGQRRHHRPLSEVRKECKDLQECHVKFGLAVHGAWVMSDESTILGMVTLKSRAVNGFGKKVFKLF